MGVVALLLLVAPAGADELWIDVDPGPDRFAMVWKEGTLSTEREGPRPFARLASNGKGQPTLAASLRSGSPVDARKRFVKLLLRVHGVERLAGLEVRLGSDGLRTSWYAFAVPLYADPEYNLVQDAEWTPVTLGFGGAQIVGTPDRGAIDSIGLVVRDQGNGPVEVDFGGWALVDEPAEGVVSLTFDDGYKEHLAAARMVAAHGWRGTAYVIPSLVGKPRFLDRAQLRDLGKLGFDVAAHDERPFTDLAPGDLLPHLVEIQRFLVEEGQARGAVHLAYPNGKQEPRRVRPAVREVFDTARLAGGGLETLPPGDRHLLRAYNVTPDTTPEQVAGLARRAREHKEWLILMFHQLVEKPSGPTEYAMKDFSRLLDAVGQSGVRVRPLSDVWETFAPPAVRRETLPAAAGR
jgi:peptidoglycan/xylan/chitin deacetylase (PgdA/CDA1 family)